MYNGTIKMTNDPICGLSIISLPIRLDKIPEIVTSDAHFCYNWYHDCFGVVRVCRVQQKWLPIFKMDQKG